MSERLDLPEPIAAYFAADRRDAMAVTRCFANDAIVKDEGHTYTGLPAITKWRTDVSAKYTFTSELLALDETDGVVVVTSRLTGNFPGSPVILRYRFRLERGKIAALEIAP
jgi:SnoaL-like domain